MKEFRKIWRKRYVVWLGGQQDAYICYFWQFDLFFDRKLMPIVELLTYSAVLNSRESQTALLKIKVADAIKNLIRCYFIKIPFYWNYNKFCLRRWTVHGWNSVIWVSLKVRGVFENLWRKTKAMNALTQLTFTEKSPIYKWTNISVLDGMRRLMIRSSFSLFLWTSQRYLIPLEYSMHPNP